MQLLHRDDRSAPPRAHDDPERARADLGPFAELVVGDLPRHELRGLRGWIGLIGQRVIRFGDVAKRVVGVGTRRSTREKVRFFFVAREAASESHQDGVVARVRAGDVRLLQRDQLPGPAVFDQTPGFL